LRRHKHRKVAHGQQFMACATNHSVVHETQCCLHGTAYIVHTFATHLKLFPV